MPQPNKGDRKLLSTRAPMRLADAICAAAHAQGLSYSDYIANVLAKEHGLPPVASPTVTNQLQMTA